MLEESSKHRRLFVVIALIVGALLTVVRPRIITISNSADALTVELVALDFLDSVRYRTSATIRAYQNDLDKFSKFLSYQIGVQPSRVMYHEVSRSSIEAFRDSSLHLEKHATVDRRLGTVKAFSKYVAEKYHTSDRAAGVRGVVRERIKFKGLTSDQHDRFLSYLDTQDPRTRFLAYFFLETGLRVISVQNATYGHFREDRAWLLDLPSKGRRPHSVPLSTTCRREFARYENEYRVKFPLYSDMPIMVSNRGAVYGEPTSWQMSQKGIWSTINKALTAVGVPKDLAHPHTLRHTFANRTLDRLSLRMGKDRAILLVRDLLGHTSTATTEQYLGNEERALEEALEA